MRGRLMTSLRLSLSPAAAIGKTRRDLSLSLLLPVDNSTMIGAIVSLIRVRIWNLTSVSRYPL